MAEDRTPNQVAYYDPGLGTDMRRLTGQLFGRGFTKNVLDCYHFIFQNYQAGDNIFLFGFSRGAATVRSLSGFIHLFGILPKCREDLIRDAFRIYQITDTEKRLKESQELVEKNSTMWCKIKFIGVWDTVAALGYPGKYLSVLFERFYPHKSHSFDLSDSVEYERQALSIDEERKTFNPVIWNALDESQPVDRLKQVWFCGVHTDVGGGYKEEGLSNITLKWMIREATDKGLLLYEKGRAFKKYEQAVSDINDVMHNERAKFPGTLFRRLQRTWNDKDYGIACIHESVQKRIKNILNGDSPGYEPWIVKNFKTTIEP